MERFNPFKGMGVAVVTPFNAEGGIDFSALGQLIENQLAGGADFLCLLGTTAETPCLTTDEKAEVVRFFVMQVNGRVPLLVGAGGNCTATVIDYLTHADLTGIDGVLIVTPYYNKPTQEGLFQHYKAVAAATNLPVILYNVPGRTGVNMTAETTLRIAHDCPNVVAVKEASGNLAQIEKILAGAPEGFEVLSGDDAITYELLLLGAAGVISVVGNALPAVFADMTHAIREGRTADALAIHHSLNDLYPLLGVDGNPAGVKTLLAQQGSIANVLRLPLVPASTKTAEGIAEWLKAHC